MDTTKVTKTWSINDDLKQFPSSLLKRIYDKDQMGLFGSNYFKSTIYVEYIPGEYTVDGIPLFVSSTVSYDGGEKQDKAVSEGAEVLTWDEMVKRFPNNK